MPDETAHNVIVYHDETQTKCNDLPHRGHVLFFVPTLVSLTFEDTMFGKTEEQYSPCSRLFEMIMDLRQRYQIVGSKLHFTDISGQKWETYDQGPLSIMELLVDALKHKSPEIVRQPFHCKVAVLFYPGSRLTMYGGTDKKEKQLRCDETMLRMLLKGALHYLYDQSKPVIVDRIITDGEPNYRSLDPERVANQIIYDDFSGRTPLRDYVTLPENIPIIPVESHHTLYPADSEEYLHANMLQAADLLLGAIIRSCHRGISPQACPPPVGSTCDKKDVVAKPVHQVLDKMNRRSGFVHSGHYRSFSISTVTFDKDGLRFRQVEPKDLRLPANTLKFDFAID